MTTQSQLIFIAVIIQAQAEIEVTKVNASVYETFPGHISQNDHCWNS